MNCNNIKYEIKVFFVSLLILGNHLRYIFSKLEEFFESLAFDKYYVCSYLIVLFGHLLPFPTILLLGPFPLSRSSMKRPFDLFGFLFPVLFFLFGRFFLNFFDFFAREDLTFLLILILFFVKVFLFLVSLNLFPEHTFLPDIALSILELEQLSLIVTLSSLEQSLVWPFLECLASRFLEL